MTTFYDEAVALAVELLDEFGADATLARRGGMTMAADGSATETGASSTTVRCMEIVAGTRMGMAGAGASQTEGGTKRFAATHILAALADPPEAGDRLTFDGRTMTINDVRTVRPTGTTILHFVAAGKP